jgi:hypothetical protein
LRGNGLIGETLARLISHIARQATEERAVELLAETALGLRRRFPLSVLKTARFVLDLAIDGEPNANREAKTQEKSPKTKPRQTPREL